MAISIEFADNAELQARIKVIGVGGGGGNALNTMVASGLEGVEFIAANTDAQALETSLASVKIQLGPQLTKGLGAGGTPEVGRKAALEDVTRISEALHGADMIFVTAGMGGGTGTGAAPVIAQIARDLGILTVGVVTRPFSFEGARRTRNAEHGLEELINAVDTIITIPNEKLLLLDNEDLSLLEAFQRADDVLVQAVRGISDLIVNAGMINVDFADVKTIMSGTGRALMGTGFGRGERRAMDAAEQAINSPLLDDVSVTGATGILINFTAGPDIKLREINEAASMIQRAADPDANIIFGVVTDPEISEEVKVTVIATGFDQLEQKQTPARSSQVRRSVSPAVQMQAPAASQPVHREMSHREANHRDPGQAPAMRHSSVPPLGLRAEPARSPSQPPQRRERRTDGDFVDAQAQRPRAFGASALHDEAVLDIPAYLRRGATQE
jgi:cell division protein FtsZ